MTSIKRLLSFSLIPLLLLELNASENTKNNGIERGFHFGELEVKKEKKDKINEQKSIPQLLADILEVQKKQLKEQKRIKEILESQYDPQPKQFINKDGKKCIENESGECYKYPILPSATRNPALANFLQNPTNLEKAINYKQWEDKHFSHVEDIGYGMKYAVLNNNQKSKTMIDSASMLSGRHNVYMTNAKADLIKKHSKDIKIFILMSDDGREFKSIRKGITESIETIRYTNINPVLVFSSDEAIKNFEKIITQYDSYILRELYELAPQKVVSKKTHETINPISYPTYLIKYKNKDKKFTQVFGAGNAQGREFINNIFEMLVYNKIIDRNEINNKTLQEYELKNFKETQKNRKKIDEK